jgi:hypothetical protein
LRTILTIIVGMLALSVQAQEIYTGAIAISPSVPTNSWPPASMQPKPTLAPGDSAKLSITVAQTGSYNGRNYTLHGNPIQHPPISSPPGSIIWRGNYSSLHACNAGNSPGTTTATVTAEWVETGSGGGGSGGSPSIIYGEATGIAQADIPVFSWSFDRRMQFADGTSPITYTVIGTIAGRRVSMNAYSVKPLSGELSVTNNTPESTNNRTGKITSTNSATSKMGVYYGERELARSDDEIAFAKVDLIVSPGPGSNGGTPLPEDRLTNGGTAPATNELNPGTIVLLLPQDQTNRVATTLTLKVDPTGGSVTLDQHGLTDLKIYTNEALQQELPIPKTWTNGDTPPSILYMVGSSSSTNLQSAQGTLDLTYKANLAASGAEYSVKDTVGVTLLPVELKQLNYPKSTDTTDMGQTESKVIGADQVAYITGAPEMPKLEMSLGGGSLSEMTVEWKIEIKSERTERGTKDDKTYPSSGYKPLPSNQPWKIHEESGSDFVAGKAKVFFKINGGTENTFEFKIRGKNPKDADAKGHIQSTQGQHRFAWSMAQHESRQGQRVYNNFNSGGSTAHLPNYGPPDGWGLAQLDEPLGVSASTTEVYSWLKNVQTFYAELNEKQQFAQAYFNKIQSIYPGQWEAPPQNWTRQGTTTQMSALEAAVIQLYNGAAVVIWVKNNQIVSSSTQGAVAYLSCWRFHPNNASGQKWEFVPNSNNYVYKVIRDEFEGNTGTQE